MKPLVIARQFTRWANCVVLITATGLANSEGQPKGYISNDIGKKCDYTQTTQRKVKYFQSLPGTLSVLTFTDPACMSGTGVGLAINKMMINNTVSRWYSHSDADFRTKPDQLLRTSPLQVRGQCIQSDKYPGIGIAIEYHTNGTSITAVSHGATVGQCSN